MFLFRLQISHRLGGWNNKHLLLTVLKARSLRSGSWHDWVLGEGPFLVSRWLSCIVVMRKRSTLSQSLLIRVLTSTGRLFPHDLITFPKSQFQYHYIRDEDFNIRICGAANMQSIAFGILRPFLHAVSVRLSRLCSGAAFCFSVYSFSHLITFEWVNISKEKHCRIGLWHALGVFMALSVPKWAAECFPLCYDL